MKKVLIVGASGATGSLLVKQLLQQPIQLIAIVRDVSAFISLVGEHDNLMTIQANIGALTEHELASYAADCDAIVSCLGHNLTWKGLFGAPRLLVTDTVTKFAVAIESLQPDKKLKFILMNTTGNSNGDIPERPPLSQRCVIALVRLLLPPHRDNEQAADFLRLKIGQQHCYIEWVAVRPDALVDEEVVTEYATYPSPIRNAIFDAGSSSRINVANFISRLLMDDALWTAWKGKMPVIYNSPIE